MGNSQPDTLDSRQHVAARASSIWEPHLLQMLIKHLLCVLLVQGFEGMKITSGESLSNRRHRVRSYSSHRVAEDGCVLARWGQEENVLMAEWGVENGRVRGSGGDGLLLGLF